MSELTPAIARTLLADATPGEWKVVSHQVSMRAVATAIETDEVRITSHDPVVRLADARLMAAAPDLARAYLAAVERAETAEHELAELRAVGPRSREARAERGETCRRSNRRGGTERRGA